VPETRPVETVRRFWDRMVHAWALDEAGSFVTADFAFRGATGPSGTGLGAFLDYAHTVRRALPDLRVDLEEVYEQGDHVAARLVFRGTHSGPLLGVPATHRPVAYVGAGFFHVDGARLRSLWLVSDTLDLQRQLTARTGARPLATHPAGRAGG